MHDSVDKGNWDQTMSTTKTSIAACTKAADPPRPGRIPRVTAWGAAIAGPQRQHGRLRLPRMPRRREVNGRRRYKATRSLAESHQYSLAAAAPLPEDGLR